jgi:hypothetical protein
MAMAIAIPCKITEAVNHVALAPAPGPARSLSELRCQLNHGEMAMAWKSMTVDMAGPRTPHHPARRRNVAWRSLASPSVVRCGILTSNCALSSLADPVLHGRLLTGGPYCTGTIVGHAPEAVKLLVLACVAALASH